MEASSADYKPVGSQWKKAQSAEDFLSCASELPAEARGMHTGEDKYPKETQFGTQEDMQGQADKRH